MKISSIILAGGRAARMGGVDKGLVLLQQKPLIAHVIHRLTPQVNEMFINANRALVQYGTFNLPVLQDAHADFIGPLAGVSVGLQHAKYDYLLTVPCDSPYLPIDLAARLGKALLAQQADIAVAVSDGNVHPVFCLCKKSVLPSLSAFINQGGRKVRDWQESQHLIEVDFSDSNEAFVNVNTLEELAVLESKLQHD
jgi:molybdopterin-guanine dinucleotide biosynthesis protein A